MVDSSQFRFHFVLGMHRSGTSAISGLLEGMGLSVGKAVMSSASDNPFGFYENTAVVDFHDRFLGDLGSTWHDPRPLGKRIRSLTTDRIAGWRKELAEISSEQFVPDRPCLVKDPRLCRLLPLWEPVLADSGVPLVMVLRHPGAVAASLAARDGFSADKALMLWLVNNLEMERESRTFKREFVLYSELLRNPGPVCRRLQQRLNLPDCDIDCLVQDRLRNDLCHQEETWPAASAKLRNWCQMVFEILQHDNPEECVLNHIFQDYEDWIGWLPDEFSGLAETKLRRELVKFAPTRKLHLQVFADQGQGFSESVSIRRDVACDKWQTIRIEHLEHLHTDPAGKLRIDPINHCGLVTLTSIRVFREHDDTNLYLADSEEEFRKIAFTSGLLPYFEKSELMLLAMEPDPQMLLPSFGPLPEAGCTLEMTLKVEIADAPLLQQFREFHDIREEHARLREKHAKLCEEHGKLFEEHEKVCAEQAMLVGEHEKLRGEKENLASQSEALAAIVESAKRWQRRSWFKRAFHRWRPPAG